LRREGCTDADDGLLDHVCKVYTLATSEQIEIHVEYAREKAWTPTQQSKHTKVRRVRAGSGLLWGGAGGSLLGRHFGWNVLFDWVMEEKSVRSKYQCLGKVDGRVDVVGSGRREGTGGQEVWGEAAIYWADVSSALPQSNKTFDQRPGANAIG
jgi:hypothetical protein